MELAGARQFASFGLEFSQDWSLAEPPGIAANSHIGALSAKVRVGTEHHRVRPQLNLQNHVAARPMLHAS
jgi:hypothetical protein